MRLDDYRNSDNVEEGRGGGGGGFGGGGLGLLFGLVGSRFGFGGIVVLIIGMMIFGMNPLSLVGGGGGQPQVQDKSSQEICAESSAYGFSCRVLANTEDTWSRLFQQQGATYQPTKLFFYKGSDRSGCGAAQSAMGPFYCPTDRKVYLDTEFFDELTTKFKAAGDFAQAYVIAHEVGHHVQNLTGIADKVRAAQQSSDQAGANALQVRMELQADCYAGVWAANARAKDGGAVMEPGDAEEGLRAAQAIGDDTLQRSAGRTPVPDSFTHGTSAERVTWLKRGLATGDPGKCDTFTSNIDAP